MAEEQDLVAQWPKMVEPGNLDVYKRPSVKNPDGGESMSIGVDGKEYLIPRVSEEGKLLSEDEAVAVFQQTGNHLGAFTDPEGATEYASALHDHQQKLKDEKVAAFKKLGTLNAEDTSTDIDAGKSGQQQTVETAVRAETMKRAAEGTKARVFAEKWAPELEQAKRFGRPNASKDELAKIREIDLKAPTRPQPGTPEYRFDLEIEDAMQDPRFGWMSDDEQVSYIRQSLANDPMASALPPNEQGKYVGIVFDKIKEDIDYDNSFNGALARWLGARKLEDVEGMGNRALGKSLSWAEAQGWLPSAKATQIVAMGIIGSGELLKGFGTGERAMSQWVDVLPEQGMYGIFENLNTLQESFQAFGTLAQETGEWLARKGEAIPIGDRMGELDDLSREFKERDGLGLMGHALNTVANVTLDSFAYLAPAIVGGMLTGGATVPAMMLQFTGGAKRLGEETGKEVSDLAALTSGVLQGALSAAEGPERFLLQMAKGEKNAIAAMRQAARRAQTRFTSKVFREMTEEGLQELIMQQTPLWTNGSVGLWSNLDENQRKDVIAGAVLGAFGGIPFAAIETVGTGLHERSVVKQYEGVRDAFIESQKPAEQRGAEGRLQVLSREGERTDQELEEIRARHIPKFVQDADDAETMEDFVTGRPFSLEKVKDFTPEQLQELRSASEAAEAEIKGGDLKPIEINDPTARGALNGVKRHLEAQMRKAVQAGKTATADAIRKSVETLHMVEPEDEAWKEIQGFAREHLGVQVLLYNYDGKKRVGGIFSTPGVVAMHAKNRADMGILGLVIHEATHNLQTDSPAAHRTLVDHIKQSFPEEWAKVVDEVSGENAGQRFKDLYAELDEDRKEKEYLAYFLQGMDLKDDEKLRNARTRLLVKMFVDFEEMSKKAEAPRGMRKLANWFRGLIENWSKKSKYIQKLTKIEPSDTSEEVQRKVYEFAKIAVQEFQKVAESTRPLAEKVAAAPVTEIQKPGQAFRPPQNSQAVQLKDMRVGDVVVIDGQTSPGRPAEILSHRVTQHAGRESAVIRVKYNNGVEQDIITSPRTIGYAIRRAPEAPVPARKSKAPKSAETKPVEQPAPEDEEIEVEIVDDQPGPEEEPLLDGDQQRLFGEPGLLPERMSPEELAKVKETDYYKAALANANAGKWDLVSAEEFHAALNRNVASVTLTPYTVEQLKGKEFKLFKLRGTEIYQAVKGNEGVAGFSNDLEKAPGIASNAFMQKILEEGVTQIDNFNATKPGQAVGFLTERYMRWGWRLMTTDEMPQWAQEAGGKHGLLPFYEPAYLEDHTKEDLEIARQYWKELGSETDPDVVFMVWDPPDGVTRKNLQQMRESGAIGTREVAIQQMAKDASLKAIIDEMDAAGWDFEEVDEQEYNKAGGETGFVRNKSAAQYWHIKGDVAIEGKPVVKGARIGRFIIRERFVGTEDHDLYFEWIDTADAPEHTVKPHPVLGALEAGGLGYRGTVALAMKLQSHFPGARFVAGDRAGGTHAVAEIMGTGDSFIRRPLYFDSQVKKMGIEMPPNRTEDELGAIHGYSQLEGYDENNWDTATGGPTDAQLDGAIEEYDLEEIRRAANAYATLNDEVDAMLREIDPGQEIEANLPASLGERAAEIDTMRKWGAKEWNAYGKKYAIPNLGGMSKLVKVGRVEVPGGVDGKWSFQELLWMQSQAWNPERVWSEAQHVQIQRKLARTLTPSKRDPLQALNHFLFAMISPRTNLTVNEVSYALRRFRDADEVKYWADKLPWDVTKGEAPSREIYDRMSKEDQEWMQIWARDERGIHDLEAESDSKFSALMRSWANDTINREHGVIRGSAGGLGIPGGTPSSAVMEMAQLWLQDPEWFLMREEESWYVFAERIASQLGGISHKVAAFGAVWQDPLFAMISAIDRHMAFIYRDYVLGNGPIRVKFENDVMKEWKKKHPNSEASNVDEVIAERGGVGVVTTTLQTLIGQSKQPVYVKEQHQQFGNFIVDPKNVELMSDAYKRALEFNMQEAQRLGLGMFATQHLQWDRQRRRFETHYLMFPEAYKAPKLTQQQIAPHFQELKDRGWTKSTKEDVSRKGEMESRLKRPRSAPPGHLPMLGVEAESPSAFERGTRGRSSVANMASTHPSAVTNPNGGPLWLIPDTSWWQRIRIKFQDKFLRIGAMQKAVQDFGGRITDPTDVYLHELLYHGRVAARVEIFEDEYIKPLMDYIRTNNIDIEAFEYWLEARHTEERNSHLTDIWYARRKARFEDELQEIADEVDLASADPDFDDTVLMRRYTRKKAQLDKLEEQKRDGKLPIAGMTTDLARGHLAQEGDKYDAAADLFDNMMNQKLQILLEGGLITQEQFDRVSIYKHYVPLKGKEFEGDLETLLDDIGAGTGSGFDIRGDELGVAMGRVGGSRATHPIISQAVVDIEDAIVRVEKNTVGQAMLAFVEEFPNPDLYEVNKLVGRRVWDSKKKEAKLVRDKFAKKAPNVLAVKVEGETFYIHMKDARMATAMKNIGSPQHGPVIKFFAAANRLMAKLNTTLNPEFVVSNLARDFQTALVHLQDKDAQGLAWKVVKGQIPAMRGIAGSEFEGLSDTEWSRWYDRFKKAGGKIGFFGYNDVVSKAKAIDRSIKRQGPGAKRWTMRQMMQVGSVIERANTVAENGIRLSAFRAAVESGMSEKQAAALARRLTVNFNKKGEAGSTLNALYLFSNASIQGNARMFQAIFRSRRVRGIVGGMVVSSAALAAVNRGMGGDDDEDGYSYYDKIPDWQKETNMIIMIPGGKGDHIKIPLPYGYNVFHVLGLQIESMMHKTAAGTLKAGDIPAMGLTLADSILGAFNPLGATRLDSSWGLFRFAVPSIAAPIADTLVNETYYGAPIQPPRSSWDKSPDSQRYFRSVNELTRKLTSWANEVTGGNNYQPGFVDVNPEVLDYLIGSYSGAGAKTGKRLAWDLPAWLLSGNYDLSDVEVRDVAFLRRVFGEENDYTVAAIYYENTEEIEQAEDAWNGMQKDRSMDRAKWKENHGWKLKVVEDLKRSRKAIKAAKTDEEKDNARKRFNRAYRRAWMSQF